jgi:hypothetical protein
MAGIIGEEWERRGKKVATGLERAGVKRRKEKRETKE